MSELPTINIIVTQTLGDGTQKFHGTFSYVTDKGLKVRCFQDIDGDKGLLRERLEEFAEKQGFDLSKIKREGIQ